MAEPQTSPPDPDATIRLPGPRPASPFQDGGPDLPSVEELTELLPTGSYQVEGFLGAGGMGAVYKGLQVRLHRPVAIKIMLRSLGKENGFEERFQREALAMARLNHPNIVSVIDYGEAGPDYHYIVMEFVDGVELMELIRSGEMTQERVKALLPQICDALQFAHDHGIVHRDIKPSNIMLTRSGQVKMADFGLAKHFDAHSGFRTQTGTSMGTPDYAAPEQFGASGDIDHRADIYALGVMIYHMVTGHVPRGAWLPPSQRTGVDAQWDDIVSRAMQSDPKDRYQAASEVKTDVSSIPLAAAREAGAATPAMAAPQHTQAGSSTPQKIRTCLGLFIATVTIVGLPTWLIMRRSEDPRQAPPSVSPPPPPAALAVAQSPTPLLTDLPPLHLPPGEPGLVKEFAISGSGFLKQLIVLPDGRRMLAFVEGTVSLIDLETTRPLWSQAVRRGLFAVSLSRDASRFATYQLLAADGRELGTHSEAAEAFIGLHETATGKMLQSWKTPTSGEDIHYHFLALSPSGRSLVARVRPAGADSSVFLRFEDGKLEPVERWQAPISHFGYTTHALSEDEYVSAGGNGALLLGPGGRVEPLVPEKAQYFGAMSPDSRWFVATESGKLGLWEMPGRKLVRHLSDSRSSGQSLAFAGGELAIMGVPEQTGPKASLLQVWHVKTGALLASIPMPRPDEFFDALSAANDGRFVVIRVKHDPVPPGGETNFVQIHRLPAPPP